LGQLKEAWRQAAVSGSLQSSGVGFWIQKLFEDTKEIRSRYLQNLGGSSYGSLVRKLIKDQAGPVSRPILLVGAGQIAQSVGPLLSESELWLSNRNLTHLAEFYTQLEKRYSATRLKKIITPVEEEQAWRDAGVVVLCIPFDSIQDSERIQWFQQGKSENRLVIHLGGMRKHSGSWGQLPEFYCLTELFQLQNSLGSTRSIQITAAERACDERSKLRSLGPSLSISHGWEDLACFA
jgi:glutamyl-tRNA reductase